MSKSDSIAIRFEHVTKSYHVGTVASVGLKNVLLHLPHYLREVRRRKPFLAVDDVSFTVERGECMGIVGRNGSGKSTTLGIIAGVLRPNGGVVETHGHVCPLLGLGAGVHPELTGRENIYLNGVLLGMTLAQVRRQFDAIVAFSELESFLDQPLRTYSSGMVARLGFSVAIHLDPEILLLDEILAVGDFAFSQKCIKMMEGLRAKGVTIVFVSHSVGAVASLCDRAVWLDHGAMLAYGDANEVCEAYQAGHVIHPAAKPLDEAVLERKRPAERDRPALPSEAAAV